jgi:serine/threonine protein kinase
MAPEVFLHEPYNSKVDVYSFAMICYQLFEQRMPFDGTDPIQAAKHAAMHKLRPHLEEMAPQTPNREVREVCDRGGLVRAHFRHCTIGAGLQSYSVPYAAYFESCDGTCVSLVPGHDMLAGAGYLAAYAQLVTNCFVAR